MKWFKIFVSAIFAGICIGIGGTVFLSVANKVVGAVLFTVGLFVICTCKLHLYTGKVCYVFQNDIKYALSVPLIWLGNVVGTNLVALLVSLTRYGKGLEEAAQKVCEAKLSDNLWSLFILGIFCNIMIYIAVDGYNSIQDPVGKYAALFLGVVVFILCGFEHCVADMYYFGMAKAWSGTAILKLLIITLGNAVGGVAFPLLKKVIANKEQ